MLPKIIFCLNILFFLLCFWVVLLLFYYARKTLSVTPSAKWAVPRWLFRCICLLFVIVYAYQASWHLAGFSRPAFMDFMRKYSRRPINPAKEIARGRILDRNGIELAINDPVDNRLRHYPYGSTFCHLIGYMDLTYGLAGIEAADNAFLGGYSLASSSEVGRFGLNILNHRSAEGNDLMLTVDAQLQKTAAELLRNRRGAIVVLHPSDGAIIALVSSPGYDPEKLDASLFDDQNNTFPLLNRAVQGLYPPGSTFKIAVAAAALESGFSELLDCPARGYTPPGEGHRPIRDHEYYEYKQRGEEWAGWGRIGIDEAFARSSNVFFAQLGVKLGADRLNSIARRFLFDKGVDLFEGSSSTIGAKSSVWPAITAQDFGKMAQQSIGQGAMLVTPLHMALITAAIAQDGKLYSPRLTTRTPLALLATIMNFQTAAQLKQLMLGTVERGTARGAKIPGVTVAGKTGTAQASDGPDHSWFVCFAPVEKPAIAMAVLVEHGGYGAASAVPIARELIKKAKKLGLLELVEKNKPQSAQR